MLCGSRWQSCHCKWWTWIFSWGYFKIKVESVAWFHLAAPCKVWDERVKLGIEILKNKKPGHFQINPDLKTCWFRDSVSRKYAMGRKSKWWLDHFFLIFQWNKKKWLMHHTENSLNTLIMWSIDILRHISKHFICHILIQGAHECCLYLCRRQEI